MYFTSGSDRAFEQLMQGKPGFDHYDSGEAVTPEDCGTCRFYRPHWKYQFCVYAECPYQPGKLTAYDAVTFRVKGVENMAVFRVERNKGYTVMSNHHLRNKDLSLKAKGLLSQFYVHSQPQEDAEGLTACYERLSQEDKLDGESNSISNQKRILEKYCRDHGYTAIRHYDEDDGYSGTNFNRPGFQRMLADIKAGKIKRVVVKDMSRFGRNYLQVGMYTEMLFPEYGVHFIAVNDGVDSVRGDSEFTAIRNVFNEMYAKDTSKKIRATWQSKGRSGEHLTTIPPYGYKKDPEDKKRWIVDEEAAAIVQKIFALCMDGMGPTQIAKWLTQKAGC